MKTLFKLAVMVLVLNATFQYARVMWDYYQLKDAAQQAVVFGSDATTDQIHAQIMRRAADLAVPMTAEQLTVTRLDSRTVAEASYAQPVRFLPRYERRMNFSFQVEGISTRAPAR